MTLSDLLPGIARTVAAWVLCAFAAGCGPVLDPAAIADAQTAVRVKTALVNDPELGGRAIEVRVVNGVVTLSGRVPSEAQAARAVELARAVPGVGDVQTTLLIGADTPVSVEEQSRRTVDPVAEDLALESDRRLLAVGGAVRVTDPRASGLRDRVTISPLFRLGSGSGFGPAVAFGWFQANLQSIAERPEIVSRVHIKPVLAGASYTFASERVSVSPSLVGGLAFNSVTVGETGAAAGVPVEVDNSLAWRPGVSVWFDVSRRLALNVSAGYLMTRLRITLLQDGRLEKRDAQGDTTLIHAGIAYKLF